MSKINNLKIGKRLFLGFSIILLLMVLEGLYAMNSLNSISGTLDTLYKHPIAVRTAALEVNADVIAIHRSMKDVALSTNLQSIDDAIGTMNLYEKQIEDNFVLIKERFLGDAKMVDDAYTSIQDWKEIRDETIRFTKDGDKQKAAANTTGKGAAQVALIEKNMKALLDFTDNSLAKFESDVKSTLKNTIATFIAIMAFAIALGIFIAFVITKGITKPLNRFVEIAKKIAQGDLTESVEIKSKDEVGELADAFNEMIENLHKLISQINQISGNVAATAEQLSAASQESSAASEEISATISQVAAAADEEAKSIGSSSELVDEMQRQIEEIISLIKQVNESSNITLDSAELGLKASDNAVDKINNIKTSTIETADTINKLSESSKQIETIVDTISSISEQTNLLALNAAIEAARAGDAGRGFAVVADEVRKLAEESSVSTQKISDLITEIQNQIKTAVESMDENSKDVDIGVEIINEASQGLTAIHKEVTGVSNEIRTISGMATSISDSTNSVTENFQLMSAAAEETASSTQEVAASAEEQTASMEEVASSATSLAELAENLTSAIAIFKY